MPEMIRFTVTQTREVEVQANNVADACRIAEAAFTHGQNADSGVINGPEGIWGNTISRIKTMRLIAERGKRP